MTEISHELRFCYDTIFASIIIIISFFTFYDF